MMVQNLTICHVNGGALDQINQAENGVQYMKIYQYEEKEEEFEFKNKLELKDYAYGMN
jgi:hypothetical protein